MPMIIWPNLALPPINLWNAPRAPAVAAAPSAPPAAPIKPAQAH